MVIRRLNFPINNKNVELEIRFNIADWDTMDSYKCLGLKESMWFTQYDRKHNHAIVDMLAPMWYIELASINEQIFGCHEYEDYVPNLREGEYRASNVEAFVASIAGKHRKDYVEKRLLMYQDIVANNGYMQRNGAQVKHAIDMLSKILLEYI